MLARILAMALSVCVCLCLPQVGVLSKRLDESGWLLAREFLSTSHALCFKEIQGRSEIRVLLSGTFLQSPEFKKCRHSISIVEACYQLSCRKVDAQSVINWTADYVLIVRRCLCGCVKHALKTSSSVLTRASVSRHIGSVTDTTTVETCLTNKIAVSSLHLSSAVAYIGYTFTAAYCLHYYTDFPLSPLCCINYVSPYVEN